MTTTPPQAKLGSAMSCSPRSTGVVLLLVAGACSPPPAGTFLAEVGSRPYACGVGFELDAEERGCQGIVPTTSCASGTMATLGARDCVPVGVPSCPEWATLDESGWGCRARLPPSPCTGATMARLGEPECVPVGACDAPFPPAEATFFVDPHFPDSVLDAHHFSNITRALLAAAPGAVIAVEAGTYQESLFPSRAVRLVGRCAAQVQLVNFDPRAPGVQPAPGVTGVIVEGFTISGHRGGVVARGGASVTVRESVLADNFGAGVVALGASSVTLERSVVRATQPLLGDLAGLGLLVNGDSTLSLSSCAITENAGDGLELQDATRRATLRSSLFLHNSGRGGYVARSEVEIEGSFFGDNAWENLALLDSRGSVSQSVFHGARLEARPGSQFSAYGLLLQQSTVTAAGCTFSENASWGVAVLAASQLTLSDSTVRGSPQVTATAASSGLVVAEQSRLTVRNVAVIEPGDVGLRVQRSDVDVQRALILGSRSVEGLDGSGVAVAVTAAGSVTAQGLTLSSAVSAGLAVVGESGRVDVSLSSSLIEGTTGDAHGDFGYGVQAGAATVMTLEGVVLRENHNAALVAFSEGVVVVRDSTLEHTQSGAGGGFGVVATTGALVTLLRDTLRGNSAAGAAFSGAGGLIDQSTIVGSGVGVYTGRGTSLVVGAASAALARDTIQVTQSTSFFDVGVQTAGQDMSLPLPLPLGQTP